MDDGQTLARPLARTYGRFVCRFRNETAIFIDDRRVVSVVWVRPDIPIPGMHPQQNSPA